MPQITVSIRMERDLKAQLGRICSEIGLPISTALTICAKAMVRSNGFPFPVKADTPNPETEAALREAEELLKDPSTPTYSFEEYKKAMRS
ncbi:MAG: type II toxin-antitoxin system RelB/DinJ family antitoxin [Sutterellaceae bacterium]|nr:type II toxin-antitoxin system RelB/DinJ family antitoxin [Sutterellaceae bacterium]MDY2869242.1 type II toxin-antitoxin system RelB/DinJ family antitoxin [Mesosutterella sp.]